MMRGFLNRAGVSTGRRHAAALMKRMGIEALYRRPNTSKPAPGHNIYPYLSRGVKVEKPNQVRATDIRLWKSAKHGEVCLRAHDSVGGAGA